MKACTHALATSTPYRRRYEGGWVEDVLGVWCGVMYDRDMLYDGGMLDDVSASCVLSAIMLTLLINMVTIMLTVDHYVDHHVDR